MAATASLSAGLIAQKGQARPAMDREIHASAEPLVLHLGAGRLVRLQLVGGSRGQPVEEVACDAIDIFLDSMLSGETPS